MRLHDTSAALGLGALLVYVAISGKAPKVWALARADAKPIASAMVAGLILTWIAQKLPGRFGDLAEGLLALAFIGLLLRDVPAINREIQRLTK